MDIDVRKLEGRVAVVTGASKGIGSGIVATEGISGLGEEGMGPFVARTPLGRVGLLADITSTAAFAVSDDGGWITDEAIQVGGGLQR